ncbi:MAG TPA: hypothetical protein VEW71_06485 [Allosphingosinicella sp.]|nr:hypothetical protein [Allosphingosinicella sp.]
MDEPPRSRWIPVTAMAVFAAIAVALGWFLLDPRHGEAAAQTPSLPDLAGRVLEPSCRQGQCRWLRVVRLETVSATARGELRRLVARGGSSRYGDEAPQAYSAAVPVRWEAQDRADYAFCSIERPAYAFPGEPGETGGLVLHYLDLFDLGGYQLSSATMYMRLCHDLPFDPEDAAPLRRLGYRPGTRSEQVEGVAPEDLARF